MLTVLAISLLLVSFHVNCQIKQGENVGERCYLQTGVGTCQPMNYCPYALQLVQDGQKPQRCGFQGRESIVCCLGNVLSRVARKADVKCEEYNAISYITIAGGNETKSQEFPHMAAVGYGDENDIRWLCGGSLISLDYVLTAGHCQSSRTFGSVRWVRLGDVDLNSDNDGSEPQQFKVVSALTYPDYRPPSHYHDIALLRLDRPAKISNFVRPGCLYTGAWPPRDAPIATGWGNTAYTGPTSPRLLKVFLALVDDWQCSQAYAIPKTRRLPLGITGQQFCAGGVKGQDTCPGDSGGPLQITSEDHRRYIIVGVTSFGKPCAYSTNPGVYIKVTSYLDWIESVVWP